MSINTLDAQISDAALGSGINEEIFSPLDDSADEDACFEMAGRRHVVTALTRFDGSQAFYNTVASAFIPSTTTSRDRHFSELWRQIRLLMTQPGENGDEPPSIFALQTTLELLRNSRNLQEGIVTTAGDGGIVIEWSHGDRSVKLNVAGSEQERTFLYHHIGNEFGVDDNPDVAQMDWWLGRLAC